MHWPSSRLIHPLSILSTPHSFADYNPENFDRELSAPSAPVTRRAQSHLPAVELGHPGCVVPHCMNSLRGAGVKLPRSEPLYDWRFGRDRSHNGRLGATYAALANNGERGPLRRTRATLGAGPLDHDAGSGVPDPEMLNLPRPEMAAAFSTMPRRFFENGNLSWFSRDAWSIAFNHYVLRFDRKF